MDAPRLIGSAGPDNLVDYDGSIWRVPQALGPTDLQDAAQRARPGVRPFPTRELAEAAPASPSPATTAPGGGRVFDVTWWETTDRYTEFIDGISSPIMRSMTMGEERSSRDLPFGACWAAKQSENGYRYPTGPDGLAICCKTPGDRGGYHIWMIDGRCSNCPMPDDKAHRCWVRHGTVGERITVDKNGLTCQAGGGSISVDGFHGMLTAGQLREC